MNPYDLTALCVIIIGAINWLVAAVRNPSKIQETEDALLYLPGQIKHLVYILVGLAGLYVAVRMPKLALCET